MTKSASSNSLRPENEATAWQSTAETFPSDFARKRVAVSLRRGLLRFVEVPSDSDDAARTRKGVGGRSPSS